MTIIVIIDDSAFQRRILTSFLKEAGYETREADNGKAGLALASGEGVGAVILDLLMPEMQRHPGAGSCAGRGTYGADHREHFGHPGDDTTAMYGPLFRIVPQETGFAKRRTLCDAPGCRVRARSRMEQDSPESLDAIRELIKYRRRQSRKHAQRYDPVAHRAPGAQSQDTPPAGVYGSRTHTRTNLLQWCI